MKPGKTTHRSKVGHGLLGALALSALLALPLEAADDVGAADDAGAAGSGETSLWQTLVDALGQILPGEEEDPEGSMQHEPGG